MRVNLLPLASIFFLVGLSPSYAQVCQPTGSGPTATYVDDSAEPQASVGINCSGVARCHDPVETSVRFEPDVAGCDPTAGSCAIKAIVYSKFPGNIFNSAFLPGDSMTKIYWSTTSEPLSSNFAICGNPGGRILKEAGESWIVPGNFSCSNPGATTPQIFYVVVQTCANQIVCPKTKKVEVKFTPDELTRQLCPRKNSCSEGDSCPQNCLGPESATSPAEGWPGFSPPASGPGATLRYAAGGVGRTGNPQPASWTARLGRYWSHDYAEVIVQAPGVAHVWLLTRWSTYREFTDGNNDGFYETVSPSDEKRRLEKVAAGWELTALDGSVDVFDSSGRWVSRSDRFGNTIAGTYDGSGRLSQVDFPDGRHEVFGYNGGGRLTSITEVGVDGITSRSWAYVWTGDLLTRIDRPDGTKLEYAYTSAFPGFMTRMTLRGSDGTSTRILAAWEYDSEGRVSKAWRGATAASSASAVDKWAFAYGDTTPPELITTVTDPLGVASTFTFGRDSVSAKPKILQLTGDCPTCGSGPNSTFTYADTANPLRPTRVVDGRGLKTDMIYDANGMPIEKIQAAETALARTITYEYDSTYPALLVATERPSTTGNVADLRRTEFDFDGSGRLTSRTLEGVENGAAFSFTTAYTPTTEGKVGTIDPPGYGTADQTVFTYDPSRGNLLPLTRSEPLIGTTSFGYDAFNRRISTTDVNGVESTTTFDSLNRVLTSTSKGATAPEDLVTESRYNVFGDLFQTVLPLGNVVEYGYDAAGRVISIERKPDDQSSSHGDRSFLTLNGNGQRIKSEHQSWNGSSWTTVRQTAWQYSTRCHVDKIIEGLPGEQSVTEMAYDCNGNVEKVWDANHPSAGQTATPSTSYTYDALNRRINQRQPFGGALGGNSDSSYSYDVQDHLNQVVDANGTVTSYVYSDRDLKTREVSEVSGTTSWTYNPHGEMLTETDARAIVTTNTVDAYDRTTFIDLPGTRFDTTYTYDDPLVPFSKGRVTKIARTDSVVEYGYDRFGRTIKDGEMQFSRDKNGNVLTLTYPGDFVATYTFDFADRPSTLSATPDGAAAQTIVSASSYRPGGQVSSLSLGNGLVETREYDSRDYPERVFVPGKCDWGYTNDASGNPTAIVDALNGANNRTFAYQDYQYFTTTGNGPWGTRGWTYDKIGNRLTETRGAITDTYSYVANAAAGRSPKISQISLGGGGSRSFVYDAAGNETQAGSTTRTFDPAGKLDHLGNSPIPMTANFVYDGRGYLAKSRGTAIAAAGSGIFCDGFESGSVGAWGGSGSPCLESPITVSTFGSQGTLYSTERGYRLSQILYFGDRPVALVESSRVQGVDDEETLDAIPETRYRFLTTDHLGTPILATDSAGSTLWSGGFEPFGRDWNGAQAAGVFLRLPGQWVDPVWSALTGADTLFQNVNRWYEPGTGTYASTDPAKMAWRIAPSPLSYVHGRPLVSKDPNGLWTVTENCSKGCKGELCGVEMTAKSVRDGIDDACRLSKNARKPGDCKKAVEDLENALGKSGAGTVECIEKLNCGDGGAKLDCVPCYGNCGDTVFGRTTLGGGTFNSDCPAGKGLGYGPTIFHESLHACNIGGEPTKTLEAPKVAEKWRQVEAVCTGWKAPVYNSGQ